MTATSFVEAEIALDINGHEQRRRRRSRPGGEVGWSEPQL